MYEIEGTLIYFPFADGVFSYNCVECGGKCCKGFGFQATPGEFVELGRRYPGLHVFARSRGTGNIEFSNLRGGCFFLDEDNLCRVHKDGGKAMKPLVCKTFPLNAYRWSGPVLVVMPHTLCPMKLAGRDPTDTVVTHADTLTEMRANWAGIEGSRQVSRDKATPTADAPGYRWSEELVRFEMASLESMHEMEHASNLDLWAYHAAIVQGFPEFATPSDEHVAEIRSELERHAQRVASFLELDLGAETDMYADPNLRAVTAIVRSTLLFQLPWLEHQDVLDMTAPTMVTFSLLTLQARCLARHALTLEATRSLIDQLFWPAVLLAYLDMIPWLDFGEDTEDDKVDVPKLSARADRFVDAVNTNHDDRTLGQLFSDVEVNDVPGALHVLQSLGRYARWLRFSE